MGRVCLKLVIVMGVTWVADLLSWAVGGPHYMWYVTDIINALQGVLIFIVVACQPQVSFLKYFLDHENVDLTSIKNLKFQIFQILSQVWTALKRFWSSKTGHPATNTTNGPQHSSSSHGLPSMDASVTNHTTASKIKMETVC